MVRRASLLFMAMVALLAVTTAASAKGRVHATLTSAIPANTSAGDHVKIAWKLRDSAGRSVRLERVFVKIICPEGTDSTTTYASPNTSGQYRVEAVVPPGGIGTVSIGTKSTTFPITNPVHRR